MNPILEEVKEEIGAGVYAPKDVGATLNSGSPNLVPGSFLFKPSDTPEVKATKYAYTVKTESYLLSEKNTTIGKLPLKAMASVVNVEALAATENTSPTAHDLIPFLRQNKGFVNPTLSEDGTTLTITVDENTPQAMIDGAYAAAQMLLPQLQNLKVQRQVKRENNQVPFGFGGFR